MPKVQADFTKISSSTESLAGGDYRFKITEIEDQAADETKMAELRANQKQAAVIFKSEVLEGTRVGAVYWDYVYLTQKDGKPNKMGLGRVKAYAEAILGQEAANGGDIDTDELLNGEYIGYIKVSLKKDKDGDKVERSELTKVLPVG